MSPVVLALDLLLVALLVLTLVLGVRLNGRLKGLKQSHAGFEKAVADLNQAAGRAEAGLTALRATSAEAHDALLARIEAARALTTRLERATFQAEKAAEAAVKAKGDLPTLAASRAEAAASRSATPVAPGFGASAAEAPAFGPSTSGPPISNSLAAIAALVGEGSRPEGRSAPFARPNPSTETTPVAPSVRRGRPVFDDDLFENEDPTPNSRPAPRPASGARPSGLRDQTKDDRR